MCYYNSLRLSGQKHFRSVLEIPYIYHTLTAEIALSVQNHAKKFIITNQDNINNPLIYILLLLLYNSFKRTGQKEVNSNLSG